mmetsp:Transcript_25841/g.64139  ORF Transcript_25841/g.64139 Transcript_25841/m.64139 type:complete len:101 (-) Transcript_25841:230-532(-)
MDTHHMHPPNTCMTHTYLIHPSGHFPPSHRSSRQPPHLPACPCLLSSLSLLSPVAEPMRTCPAHPAPHTNWPHQEQADCPIRSECAPMEQRACDGQGGSP